MRVDQHKRKAGRRGRLRLAGDEDASEDHEGMVPPKSRPRLTNAASKERLTDSARLAKKSHDIQQKRQQHKPQRPPAQMACTHANLASVTSQLHATVCGRVDGNFPGHAVECVLAVVARGEDDQHLVAVVSNGPIPKATNLEEVLRRDYDTMQALALAPALLDDEATAAARIKANLHPALADDEQLAAALASSDQRQHLVQRVALFFKSHKLGRDEKRVTAADLPDLLPVMAWTEAELGYAPKPFTTLSGGGLWKHMGAATLSSGDSWFTAKLLPRLDELVREVAAEQARRKQAAAGSLAPRQLELLRDHHVDSLQQDKARLQRQVAELRRVVRAQQRPCPRTALEALVQDDLDAEVLEVARDALESLPSRAAVEAAAGVAAQAAQAVQAAQAAAAAAAQAAAAAAAAQAAAAAPPAAAPPAAAPPAAAPAAAPDEMLEMLAYVNDHASREGPRPSGFESMKWHLQRTAFDTFPPLKDVDPRRDLDLEQLAKLQHHLATTDDDYKAAVRAVLGEAAWTPDMEAWWTTAHFVGRVNPNDRAGLLLGYDEDLTVPRPGHEWYARMEETWLLREQLDENLSDRLAAVKLKEPKPERRMTRAGRGALVGSLVDAEQLQPRQQPKKRKHQQPQPPPGKKQKKNYSRHTGR